jgi:hypothetical protein
LFERMGPMQHVYEVKYLVTYRHKGDLPIKAGGKVFVVANGEAGVAVRKARRIVMKQTISEWRGSKADRHRVVYRATRFVFTDVSQEHVLNHPHE